MAAVIAEFVGATVIASDIFDYGFGRTPRDFLHDPPPARPAWIITNPPFKVEVTLLPVH
jgi:hypothetical protein